MTGKGWDTLRASGGGMRKGLRSKVIINVGAGGRKVDRGGVICTLYAAFDFYSFMHGTKKSVSVSLKC